jgi:hypothetical protein
VPLYSAFSTVEWEDGGYDFLAILAALGVAVRMVREAPQGAGGGR